MKQDDRSAQVRMRSSITQRCSAPERIELTSLVSTSRYWVWSPMSGIYTTIESARVCCHATRTNGPLSGTGYAVAVTHTNLLRHRHTFLDMQYECDTSKAARGTGADLSIHRLELTVTQHPYTAVRTSPCSRNPFLTLRRPAKLPVPV